MVDNNAYMAKKKIAPFDGFSRETLAFLYDLKEHNSKNWFDQNRERYETHVKAASERFVVAMGEKLKELSPTVNAEPRVNRSIFKINRDVRFSKDKTPYKTHIAIIFWDGGARMQSPSFYFHVSPEKLMLGVGLYRFDKEQLDAFRASIVHSKYGPQFDAIVQKLEQKGYSLGGKKYKRVPRGFEKDHPYAEYLMYGGVHVGFSEAIPSAFFSKKILNYCQKRYMEMLDLEQWLVAMVQRI